MSNFGFVFVSPLMYNYIYKKKERGDTMSANVYSVQNLLVGKQYRSATLSGEIISAEPNSDVWYKDCDTYLVQVRPYNSIRDTYRYVAVKVSD
jgi:hypothetical protein